MEPVKTNGLDKDDPEVWSVYEHNYEELTQCPECGEGLEINPDGCCNTCQFFHYESKLHDIPESPWHGTCRFGPAQMPVSVEITEETLFQTTFPPTGLYDWCRAYEPKTATDPTQ